MLRSLRGQIIDARIGYPEVLHFDVRDRDGDVWRFSTQYADWTPGDPDLLPGRVVEGATIDASSRELSLVLSGDVTLKVIPGDEGPDADDDPPYWELFTPDGMLLEFGPGVRWQICDADQVPKGP